MTTLTILVLWLGIANDMPWSFFAVLGTSILLNVAFSAGKRR